MASQIQNVELTSRGIKKVLNKYTPQRAISEFIWNGFDAGANCVKVSVETEPTFNSITKILIDDNGQGICHEQLSVVFKKFYESQKSALGNLDSRFSRGKNGYGRFTFFKLCRETTWTTRYLKDTYIMKYDISMHSDRLIEYVASLPMEDSESSPGTTVKLSDFSDSDLSLEWISATLVPYLKSEFAWYVKLYPSKHIYLNEELIDCSSVIADSDFFDLSIELPNIDNELFHCTYFQWNEKPQDEYSRFYFMDSLGNLKHQKTTLLNKKGDSFWHSILVKSTFFNSLGDEHKDESEDLFSSTPQKRVMKELYDKLNDYLRNKRRPFLKQQAEILVDKYEKEKLFDFIGNAPWEQGHKSYLQSFIKDLYEVEPTVFIKLNETQRKIFVRLLDQVMDTDNNGALFSILSAIVDLDEEDRNRFAEILGTTKLKNVIATIKLIDDRIEIIEQLKLVNFDHTLKAGEVAHLQKIIANHYWIFGEEFRFVCSEEVKFQEAFERYMHILKGVSKKEYLEHPDKYKEMDLFLTGRERRDNRPSNLVIEIKSPTNVPELNMEHYGQINKYMDVIMKEDVFNDNNEVWTFVLIGLKIHSTIIRQMGDKLSGLCINEPNARLYIKTWSQVLNEAEDRMTYLKEQLMKQRQELSTKDSLDMIMYKAMHNSARAKDVVQS